MTVHNNSASLTRRAAVVGGLASMVAVAAPRGAPAADGGSLAGRTALVTGSTDGLGEEVALRLGQLGATVIVHGRSVERGEAVAAQINDGPGSAVFYRADLAAMADVRALADEVMANHDRLDLLINNAGIGGGPQRQESPDGHELVFAVNYLSNFLLTQLLLPMLRDAAPSRVVNVASIGQEALDFDDLMLERGYEPRRSYAQSKLAQILFTFELAPRIARDGIVVNALHPATFMDTGMVRRGGREPLTTVDEGADAVMQLAVAPEMRWRTGLYFNGLEEARANEQAYDVEAREALWQRSMELVGMHQRSWPSFR